MTSAINFTSRGLSLLQITILFYITSSKLFYYLPYYLCSNLHAPSLLTKILKLIPVKHSAANTTLDLLKPGTYERTLI